MNDFFQRTCWYDQKVTINKYHDGSIVKKENVYTLFHIINIALLCEYGEITYHYIRISPNSPLWEKRISPVQRGLQNRSDVHKLINHCILINTLKNGFQDSITYLMYNAAYDKKTV